MALGDPKALVAAPPPAAAGGSHRRTISSRLITSNRRSHRTYLDKHFKDKTSSSTTMSSSRRPSCCSGRVRSIRKNGKDSSGSSSSSRRSLPAFKLGNFHFLLAVVLLVVLGGYWVGAQETDSSEANGEAHGTTMSTTTTTESFNPEKRGSLKFGDKCENTTECGFAGSVCDPSTRTCQCIPDLPATNHIDKCGKKAQVNESCFFTEQCEQMTEQTECRDQRCICRFEMNPIFKPDGTVECRVSGIEGPRELMENGDGNQTFTNTNIARPAKVVTSRCRNYVP
ncbi:uncharacterized protein LOC129738226 [Uranotaenia lowii]|uniref:uncharacterized protein LOC129738226 n=1 Tax=Uranotaenia lowii TaxID=190385 RepID=UPI002478DB2B|nr:uncharacterized protein LOC129738226 [Uranotaenia lowii]